jgi:UMF1 family MFS transporter
MAADAPSVTARSERSPGLLARIGLRTPEQRAWAMYDWANSAMIVIVVTAVFPIFFSSYAAADLPRTTATFRYSVATTIGLTIIALLSPLLGAIADYKPLKKKMLGGFLALGVVAIALMFFIPRGGWLIGAVLFVLANIGANGSFVFYDSLLPHVANTKEIDRVSTAGYALGYVGGGLILLVSLVAIQRPDVVGLPSGEGLTPAGASLPARLAFVATAVWWALFAIPLFRRVPEPRVRVVDEAERRLGPVRVAVSRLRRTFGELRRYRNAFLLLVAFLIYNDGIGTIIRMAAIYGEEIGIERGALIGAIVLVQFVGIPFAFLFGQLATRIGSKSAIFVGLAAYVGITVVGYFMRTATHFFVLAALVGMVQGGTQALSRSLFGSMIPRHESGEFFGLFAVFEKFAGIFGPAIFGLMLALTGSSRSAILSIVVFFIVGAILLTLVNVDEGRRVAREAERSASLPAAPSSA